MSSKDKPPTSFTSLPNEIVLIIWKYLTNVETIKSFGGIKCQRYHRLLEAYCYKSLNFSKTSLSTFEFCCKTMLDTHRSNVEILQLGHDDSYSQLRLFTQFCLTSSSLEQAFPKLKTLILRHVHEFDIDDFEPYFSPHPFIENLTLIDCPLNKISTLICEYILNKPVENRLRHCTLRGNSLKDGIYVAETITSTFQPQYSLVYLQVDIVDLKSLKHLLTLLPALRTLDFHLSVDVKQNDRELFPSSFCPCPYLTKLIMRLRNMTVEDFTSIVLFIRAFRNSLLTLHLALIHQDANIRHSVNYIHGEHLYNEIVAHMQMLNEFSFWIETTCLCHRQMENLVQSFQTKYWLNKQIAFHHDRTNCIYIMLTLPFVFDLRFMVVNDIINTKFNRNDLRLECLTSMLFDRTPGLILLTDVNETLHQSFFSMLNQGSRRCKSIKIKPDGIYQMEHVDMSLSLFDKFELDRRYEFESTDGFICTTIGWLHLMSHLRILNLDIDVLNQLTKSCIKINQFSFLETLIVRQTKKFPVDDSLSIISNLGISSSLRNIHLRQYRVDFMSTKHDIFKHVNQICTNMCSLEVLLIEFNKDALMNDETLNELFGKEKKNCHLKYVHLSNVYIELCFAR